ncbi:uncharacterized protein LKV04_001641 [Tautogolabrus adspersus]
MSVESTQSEDLSSQALSDLTPGTVTCVRQFSPDELLQVPSQGKSETSSDEARPRTSGQFSEVDYECFVSQPISVPPKAKTTLSSSDEEYNISPGSVRTASNTKDDTDKLSLISLPKVSSKGQLEIPEENRTGLCNEDSTPEILQSQEKFESTVVTNDLWSPADFGKAISVESTQSEDVSSPALSDLTPETVTHARQFSYEELLETSSYEARPRVSGQSSEESPTRVDHECFVSQPISDQCKAETTSSSSDEEYNIPPGNAKNTSNTKDYTDKLSLISLPKVSSKGQLEIPEENRTGLCNEDSTPEILQSQEKFESTFVTTDLWSPAEEISTQSTQNEVTLIVKAMSVESTQSEDLSSQALSDLTPGTVTCVRQFSPDELLQVPSSGNSETSSDEARPRTSGQISEVDYECFVSKPISVPPKTETTLSSSDEEYNISPGSVRTASNTKDDTDKLSLISLPKVPSKGRLEIPEENRTGLCNEDSTPEILQSQEKFESTFVTTDLWSPAEEISTQSTQNEVTHFGKAISVESTQSEDVSSPALSDLTPETVTLARQFSYEELLETSSYEGRPRVSGQSSEESPTRVDHECFGSQPISDQCKAETTSSSSDEEYNIPPGNAKTTSNTKDYTDKLSLISLPKVSSKGQLEIPEENRTGLCNEDSTPEILQSQEKFESTFLTNDLWSPAEEISMISDVPPEYATVVRSGTGSPTFQFSDPEPFFDCRQAASDFSETDELDTGADQPEEHLSFCRMQDKVNRRVLLSSGSEDYEDAPFVPEPLQNEHEENEELLSLSEDSDEEFSLCEAAQPPPIAKIGAYDDTDTFVTRT